MHIPQWDKAVGELCRVLKPGGKMLLLESNSGAVETWLVRGIRKVKKTVSRVEYTPGGMEFWTELDGLETGDDGDDGWLMWGANAAHNGLAE